MHGLRVKDAAWAFVQLIEDAAAGIGAPVNDAVDAEDIIPPDRAFEPVTDHDAHIIADAQLREFLLIVPCLIAFGHLVGKPDDIGSLHAVIEILEKEHLKDPQEQECRIYE